MQHKKLSAAIAAMYAAVAQANNLSPEQVREDFSVAPAAVQRMYDEIGKSSELLKQINISGKVEKVGDVIGLSTGLIGSNTDTSDDNTERKPRSIHSLSKRTYKLEKTNFDVRLRYDEIDQWAHVTSDCYGQRLSKPKPKSDDEISGERPRRYLPMPKKWTTDDVIKRSEAVRKGAAEWLERMRRM